VVATVAAIADSSKKYWQLFASQLIKSSSEGGNESGRQRKISATICRNQGLGVLLCSFGTCSNQALK
jgi:hypothetical protein